MNKQNGRLKIMVELNPLMSRTYSRLGQRGSIFGIAVLEAAKSDDKFLLLTADLATLSGMDRYVKLYPSQFVNVGIAEQNMLGVAAGLAAEGYHPVVTTYATFVTMRSCEQIRHYLGYMGLKVVVIGSGAGLCQGFAGNTHYTIEDVSIMRAIPNMVILSPADAGSAVKLLEIALRERRSVYMRLTGNLNCPVVYKENYSFAIGGSNTLKEGNEITLIATGTMVSNAMEAALLLEQDGISVSVIDMYSIKPIDANAIQSVLNCKLLVSIEEHSVIGGLGGAISEVLTMYDKSPRLLRMGISDEFNLAGDYINLLSQNNLLPSQICDVILNELK